MSSENQRQLPRLFDGLDGSDDEVLADDDKRSQQQQYQKKKRRPSFKRRKKAVYDHTQTDSGIDSRMGRTQMFIDLLSILGMIY